MVRHEMQRAVSMVRSGAMAPVGQVSTHPAARAAVLLSEWRVVGVGLVGEDQLAQQDAGAELRRHEQRLASDPAQSGLRGQLFFGQRRRVGERRPPSPGYAARRASNSCASMARMVV